MGAQTSHSVITLIAHVLHMGAQPSQPANTLTDAECERLALLVEIAGDDGHGIREEVLWRGDIMDPGHLEIAYRVRLYVETHRQIG